MTRTDHLFYFIMAIFLSPHTGTKSPFFLRIIPDFCGFVTIRYKIQVNPPKPRVRPCNHYALCSRRVSGLTMQLLANTVGIPGVAYSAFEKGGGTNRNPFAFVGIDLYITDRRALEEARNIASSCSPHAQSKNLPNHLSVSCPSSCSHPLR